MKKRLLTHLMGLALLIGFVLTQFQNCAPVAPGETYSTDATGEVRVIDDWNQGKLSFVVRDIAVDQQDQEVTLDGFCARKGDGLSVHWFLVESIDSPEDLDAGVTDCVRGGFRLHLSNVNQLECNKVYTVLAGYNGVQEAEMTFHRACSTAQAQ